MMTLLATLACTSADPKAATTREEPSALDEETQDTQTTPLPTASDTGCLPAVAALLFDLGETLVTEQGDVFVTRPDAMETIAELRALSLPLGIVTNTLPAWDEDDLRALLAEPEILDLFDVVLLSSLADSPPKPDPAIFLEAHALLPGAPSLERTAFVTEETGDLADRANAPTEGARAAGLFGVLLSETDSPLADARVSSLSEIPEADWLRCER